MREPLNVSLWDVMDKTQFCAVGDMTVTRAEWRDVDEFCRRWHYTATKGSAMWNYGLWDGFTLVGVVSYNLPTMRTCASVFGSDRWESVAHMGRLVCADDAPRNSESRLIAGSLRLLIEDRPQLRAVLTFAAQDEGHVGYVYQATNALYTGTGGFDKKFVRPDGTHVASNASGGRGKRSLATMREQGVEISRALPKHRYVYLLGDRRQRRESRRLLRLPVLPYPKANGAEVAL